MINSESLKKSYTVKSLAKEICFAKPLKIFILLTVFSMALRVYYTMLTGLRIPNMNNNYDAGFFISGAKLLLSSPAEYFAKFIKMPFYMGYSMTLAAVYAVTGGSNAAVILLQIIFSSVCPFLIWKSCENLFGDRKISLIAALMTAVLPIGFRWVSQLTSDSFGMFSSVLCIFAFSVYNSAEKGNRRRETVWLLLSLLGFFLMRTTAGTVIAVILISMVSELPTKKRVIFFGCSAVVLAGAVIFMMTGDGIHSLEGNIQYFNELYESGEVVQAHYFYDKMGNVTDIFGIIFYRLLYYLCPYDIGVGITGGHRLSYQLLHYLPLVPVFIFAFMGGIRGFAEKNRIMVIFSWVIIFSALVQSVTEIQFDLRYRDPVLPYFYMLAAYEIIKFADSIKKKQENITGNEA